VNLVVDTSVWSLFLRRKDHDYNHPLVKTLNACLERHDGIFLIGPILQEILDGIRYEEQFRKLLDYFSVFPLIEISRNDYVEASRLRNYCRCRGVQAGPADFLIASVCIHRNYPLLTGDGDFNMIAKHCRLSMV
jgi:predicted nucleic acid-binding protein